MSKLQGRLKAGCGPDCPPHKKHRVMRFIGSALGIIGYWW
jgi:hypothetical protein